MTFKQPQNMSVYFKDCSRPGCAKPLSLLEMMLAMTFKQPRICQSVLSIFQGLQ